MRLIEQKTTVLNLFLKIFDSFPLLPSVFDFISSTFADITARIDDVDTVGHVYFSFVHVIEHGFDAIGPHLFITAVSEKADTDHNVPLKGQSFLHFEELLLKACATTKGYDGIFADHTRLKLRFFYIPRLRPNRENLVIKLLCTGMDRINVPFWL